jgi:hypothetical protein
METAVSVETLDKFEHLIQLILESLSCAFLDLIGVTTAEVITFLVINPVR